MHEESHTVIAENERAQKERGNQIQTINAKGIERMRRRKAKELQGDSRIGTNVLEKRRESSTPRFMMYHLNDQNDLNERSE